MFKESTFDVIEQAQCAHKVSYRLSIRSAPRFGAMDCKAICVQEIYEPIRVFFHSPRISHLTLSIRQPSFFFSTINR